MNDTARMWLERLQNGDCSERDYQEFDRWIADENHKRAFENARLLEAKLDALAENEALLRLQERVLANTSTKSIDVSQDNESPHAPVDIERRPWWARLRPRERPLFSSPAVIVLPACLAILLGGILWWIPLVKNTHTTAIGEQRLLMLSDGSAITLDTDTQIRVAYRQDERRIILTRGRAYFEVLSDPGRSFTVIAGSSAVKVVGTAFSVHRVREWLEVMLKEGSVVVQADGNAEAETQVQTLSPGQQLVYDPHSGLQRHTLEDLDERMSWLTGKIIFSSARFADVVAEVNRYSENPLRLMSPELHDLEVNAVFDVEDVSTFVLALQSSFHLTVMHQLNGDIELRSASK